MLGNFNVQHRSKTDQLELDLVYLEKNGVIINNVQVPTILFSIVGDNLGSHTIGGFVANFSTGKFFCRYCTLDRQAFDEGKFCAQSELYRTSLSYQDSVSMLSDEDVSVEGVKFNSVFNVLKYYNVCNPGLPPSLGHDLFEGIVKFDLPIFLTYFIKKKKWYKWDCLNKAIQNFHYLNSDCDVKPCPLKPISNHKLCGSACQNWCFLRLLPLLDGQFINDRADKVWELVILLRLIVQHVTAPKISEGQICYLKCLIERYLALRHSIFPDIALRPKHHYLAHYPDLIIQFGPLIRLWTLRFGQKHQFFKRAICHSPNFINITSTLSKKHQLLQACNSSITLFSNEVIVHKSHPLLFSTYSNSIGDATHNCGLHKYSQVSVKIEIKGTLYKSGMIVVLSECELSVVEVGVIVLVLVDNNQLPHFLVQKKEAHYLSELGVFQILEDSLTEHLCIASESLYDNYPLSVYIVNNASFFVLKHQLFDK
ncbi:uncharacterized protein LOC136096064 [Hydra vulgaris]|uniref:uncharacterized protein LOC136096064 n=1 Tax=Hydra vulgaris TaxID=6087 RepID=UPI0032EA748F